MAITVNVIKRVFSYSSISLPDPGLNLTPEEVKDIYSATYPELITASIVGPVKKGANLVFTFEKQVGTKG